VVNPLPAYDRLKEIASHGFLVGAFFPWVFVLIVDGTIYEFFIPDGVSLVDRFLALEESDQLYAAIALVIGLAGLAAASDLLANEITEWYRRQSWRRQEVKELATRGESGSGSGLGWLDKLEFEQRFAWLETQLDERIAEVLLMRVDAAQSAIKRSAIFIIGFGLSIVYNTIQFLKFQPDHMLSFYVLLTLWFFLVGPLFLIHRQFKTLLHYDQLIFASISADSKTEAKAE
jgi:hypothetical protein